MPTTKTFAKVKLFGVIMDAQTSLASGIGLKWNPSITDTFGDQQFVPYSEVSLTQGLTVYFR